MQITPLNRLFLALVLAASPVNLLAEASITATFEDVETFQDFEYSGMNAVKTKSSFLRALDREGQRVAKRVLEDGQTLKLHFKDIDMAGDVQPWRNRDNADIRYIESVYPPRLEFDYQLLNADGKVIEEGEAKYTDLAFDFSAATKLNRDDPFFFEIQAIENWIRRKLK